MVYRHPGKHKIHGELFDFKIVDGDTEELDAALSDGWHLTTPEALDGAAPTREELEAKAKELGLSFPANIGDAKLLARIEEALAKQ